MTEIEKKRIDLLYDVFLNEAREVGWMWFCGQYKDKDQACIELLELARLMDEVDPNDYKLKSDYLEKGVELLHSIR